jgi:hypothetical protein
MIGAIRSVISNSLEKRTMPIFEKNGRRVVFIHVPKAAGSSVEQLFKNEGWEMSFYKNSLDGNNVSPQHMTYQALSKHVPDIDELISFAIVREPFQRLVSEWRYQTELIESSKLEFNDFVRHLDCSLAENKYYWDNHWRPQTDFIDESIDQVIKIDSMNESLLPFLRENEIMVDPVIPHTNKRKKKNTIHNQVSTVSDESKERILRVYGRDYAELGYEPTFPALS